MHWHNKLVKPSQWGFFKSEARFPAFVAGWGTGKTRCAILKGMSLSTQYPGNLGLVVRKNFTDLRDSTMKDFTRYTGIKVPSNKDVTLENGSQIMFRHMDELAGVVQNVNLGWYFIEQAEEFESEKEFTMLRGRLRRDGVDFVQGMIIANTNGHNWIWRLWKNKDFGKLPSEAEITAIVKESGMTREEVSAAFDPVQYPLYEATTYDNKANLRPDFISDLMRMKVDSPSHYRRFVLNSWEDTDTADKVIPYQKILEAVDRDLIKRDASPKVITCDPAEYGDDKSVIYALDGYRVIDKYTKILTKRSTMETAGFIVSLAREFNASVIAIDDIGVGAGVRARIAEVIGEQNLNTMLLPVNSGRRPEDKIRYNRLRDQMWMHASYLFKNDYVSIPNDNDLIEDLGAFTYSMNSKGQIIIVRKKDIKKILNRSPDRADALVMGLWAVNKAPPAVSYLTGQAVDDNYDPLTFELNVA